MKEKQSYLDGVYDISNEEYHGSNGISRSQLVLLDKSPQHFWYEVYSGKAAKREPTPAMNIGSAFHTLLLEPQKFDDEFAVMPNIDRRTSSGKEQYAKFAALSEGKIILTKDQYENALEMVKNILKHEIVYTLLEEAVFEQSIFWTDKETGLQFKVRPDIWASKMVVDVKTSGDANYYAFQRSAINYGYYLQAGMIHEACKAIDKPFDMFVHLVCEKEAPYAPAVYMMTPESLQFGIDQFIALKTKLADCISTDKWPAYAIKELDVPKYMTNALDNE